jgi:hypothetical protein
MDVSPVEMARILTTEFPYPKEEVLVEVTPELFPPLKTDLLVVMPMDR